MTIRLKKIFSSSTPALQSCAFLIVLYAVLAVLLPANKQTLHAYHLQTFTYHIILLALSIPSLIVWAAAFAGYAKLHQYSQTLRGTPEGLHLDRLATGTAWLAWALPITATLSLLLSGIHNQWPSLYHPAIVLENYLNLIFPLIAFSVIAGGSRGLLVDAKLNLSLASTRAILALFIFAGVMYCYFTFQHFDLTSLSTTQNPYFLPVWAMVLTVIIPYLYAWFVGLLASYEIILFSKHVGGVLYRQALRLLVSGLIAVIISSIAQQYLNSAEPRVGYLTFNYRLVMTLIFRVIDGVGFILIVMGAIRLKKIEDV